MRLIIQRVKDAKVLIDENISGQNKSGMLVFLGIHKNDSYEQADWLVKKLVGLRIFRDPDGKMNYDIRQAQGDFLVVSQFTLYGSCQNGKRPEFTEAALPEFARLLYDYFNQKLSEEFGKEIQTGEFGAYMEVAFINDGPVTFLIER